MTYFSRISDIQGTGNFPFLRLCEEGVDAYEAVHLQFVNSKYQIIFTDFHELKFSGIRVCRVTFKHLPQPLRSHILSFGTLVQLFKIHPFPPKNRIVPRIFWGVGILTFLLLRSPCKIAKPYDNLFWEN
jgi:hypothetical protein